MPKAPVKKTVKKPPAPKKALTLQQQFDKWSLPVVFVALGSVIVWSFVNAYLHHGS